MAQNERGRRSAIDGRTTRHEGYRQSQRRRKRVEEVFGWIKTVGAGGKLRYLGRARNKLWFELTAAAYNLTRLVILEVATATPNGAEAASGVGTAVRPHNFWAAAPQPLSAISHSTAVNHITLRLRPSLLQQPARNRRLRSYRRRR